MKASLLVYKILTFMISTSNRFCRQIANVIMSHGVNTAYCSPGSRNAPLMLALESCRQIKKHVVVDERSAAFQALGCALVEQRPVVLVCTSGTAVLNYAPAVAEAYYAGVPLIVISADRPLEWIDQDDSQTIRQFGVLDSIVKGSYDVRAIPDGKSSECFDEMQWMINRTVNEAMLKALDGKPGPVHINVQLAEPLGDICDFEGKSERKVSLIRTWESVDPIMLKELASDFVNSKVLLVAGFMSPDHRLDRAVRSLASLPNVVVMAETLANLHNPQPHASMIDSVLCRMNDADKERLRPDIVISIGGALVSRMLKQYLRKYPPRRHWSVGHYNYFCDCFMSLTEKVDVSPASFLRQLFGVSKRLKSEICKSFYAKEWLDMREKASIIAAKFIDNCEWSDLKAFSMLMKGLKIDNLFVSNGTSVRYSQILSHDSHAEYCNRGVSGIDGVTSTSVGAARSYPGQTTLISGDTSWLYDSGASAFHDLPYNMRMVVFDNSGGGIFRFIKATSGIPSDTLEKYFCVGDHADIEAVALSYGIETMSADCEDELEEGMKWLNSESESPRLLVVKTPPHKSAEILVNYFK